MKGSYSINFRLEREGVVLFGDGLTAVWGNGAVTVVLTYDSNRQPLALTGRAVLGDSVVLTVRPYRVELAVNGRLTDEEWPWGEPLWDAAKLEGAAYTVGEAAAPVVPAEQPAVLGTVTDAEGWTPGGGVNVGDCMPYEWGGRYHLLYLKDRRHHRSKWCRGAHQWEHLSTADFREWQIHPMAVEIDDPLEASICTGSWIEFGGKQWLYYTVRTVDGSPAKVARSVSDDGWHFRKDRGFSFTLSPAYHQASARDPKVVLAEDGLLHMFVTTSKTATGHGCLAHLTSADGDVWTEIGEIYEASTDSQPECSDYFAFGGRYYLLFSHGGRAEYRVSDRPFDGWVRPDDPHIPCSSVPKEAIHDGRILFAGFQGDGWGYGGCPVFTEAFADKETGLLSFRRGLKG